MPIRTKLLDSAGARTGDRVRLKSSGLHHPGHWELEGVLMPHGSFSGEFVITLKLDNGYNVGIDVSDGGELELVERNTPAVENRTPATHTPNLERISILSTGGTIASYVDHRTGAVFPALDENGLLRIYPELAERYSLDARIVLSKLSEDIGPGDWITIAREVVKAFGRGSQGVVIAHGTDTLGYTAAAMSFMLRGLPGPVVLVGSQRSSDRPSSDAALNLLSAMKVASDRVPGIFVVMHSNTSDGSCIVLPGTRTRKMHTSRRDAFRAVNSEPVAYASPESVKWLPGKPETRGGTLTLHEGLEEHVDIVWAHPGITPGSLGKRLEGLKGVVIAGTGLGHIGSANIGVLRDAVSKGTLVGMSSQCLYGRVNMSVYSTGRDLTTAGVIPLGDMLPETALVKMMWVLGQGMERRDAVDLLLKNIAGERDPVSRPTETMDITPEVPLSGNREKGSDMDDPPGEERI